MALNYDFLCQTHPVQKQFENGLKKCHATGESRTSILSRRKPTLYLLSYHQLLAKIASIGNTMALAGPPVQYEEGRPVLLGSGRATSRIVLQEK